MITAKSCVRLQTIWWISNDCVWFSDVSGSSTSTLIWSRLNHDMEEKGIVARDCLPPEPRCPLTRHHGGGGQRGSGGRQSRAQSLSPPCRGSCTSGSQSKSSFSPQFLVNHGWENRLLVTLWKYQRHQRTRRVIGYNTNSRTFIQITKKCRTVVAHCRPKFSGRAKQWRGGNISPYDNLRGKFQIGTSELCFLKGGAECLLLILHPTKFLATWKHK